MLLLYLFLNLKYKIMDSANLQKIITDYLSTIDGVGKVSFSIDYSDGKMVGGKFIVNSNTGDKLTTFNLSAMVGCNGVAISNGVVIYSQFRGKGLAARFIELREIIATAMGFGVMMCTVVVGNKPQERAMIKRGWRIISVFQNPRTKNEVQMFFKKL